MNKLAHATSDFPYKRGEFIPWFIPRELMPQLDDMEAFRSWSERKSFRLTDETIDPWDVVCRQRVSVSYARQIPDWKLAQPGVISGDNVMLDGNHRWLKHLILLHQPITIIRFPLPFFDAIPKLEHWCGVKAEPSTIGGAITFNP